ncbi:MAG: 3-dehydroquinate synthase [Opitutus sp.]
MAADLIVELGERAYPITFGESVTEAVKQVVFELQSKGRRVAVVTDRNVEASQHPAITSMFNDAPRFAVEPGESAKSIVGFGSVLEFLAVNRVDRTGAVFAIGGGVVGDLGGFAAASWLRGVDLYQIPTTLLAMVDSSVGGKTGINLPAGKNLVGAFHQPRGVFVGTDFLRTLPEREFAAGMAEVIKCGLLADEELFDRLAREPLTVASGDLSAVVRRCCAIKAAIVQADERELAKEGGRALLNLGHTFGHAIEQVAGYGVYLHGEAVAIGLCAAAKLSQALGLITEPESMRVERVVLNHKLPVRLRSPLALTDLFEAMANDKKVRAGVPRFVILKKLGEAQTADDVPLALARGAFRAVGAT